MLKKFIVGLLAVGFVSGVSAESNAQSPFEFSYGYSLGIQNSFRNRLPAPPYFAVFPPVYYGQRYERPYGESPFASWPLLQPNEAYQPVRAATRVMPPVVVSNPYVIPECAPSTMAPQLQWVPDDAPVLGAALDGVHSPSDSAGNGVSQQEKKTDTIIGTEKVPAPILPVVVHNPFVKALLVSK